ncbi:MAG: hypothetical protein IJ011_01445 [Clostridia bacterium]|nr:hypothetical protein [Clostridia bacterium]
MGNFSDDDRMANGTELLELAEELDDARQEAEAADAQAALEKLSEETSKEDKKEEKSEEQKRREHEEAEAKRKAEWEAKQKAKEEEEIFKWETAIASIDGPLAESAMRRVSDEVEWLTHHELELSISEMLQTRCIEDSDLVRQIYHPRKSMLNCFKYVRRKAEEYVKKEMMANGIEPRNIAYGSAIPQRVCYQWAIDYFFDMDAPEDKDPNEEKFVPKPYTGKTVTTPKKKAEKKKPEPKKETLKSKSLENEGQMDMFSMLGGTA